MVETRGERRADPGFDDVDDRPGSDWGRLFGDVYESRPARTRETKSSSSAGFALLGGLPGREVPLLAGFGPMFTGEAGLVSEDP